MVVSKKVPAWVFRHNPPNKGPHPPHSRVNGVAQFAQRFDSNDQEVFP